MTDSGLSPEEEEQKQLALRLILDAWDTALKQNVPPELLASSAIFAALTDMVAIHGEKPVATMLADLPQRVLDGEFSFDENGQPQS